MTHAADVAGLNREQQQIDRSMARVIGATTLDQEARDLGHKAISRVDTHETLCTERWNQQRLAMVMMQKTLDAMARNTIGRVLAGIIAALMGLVGWLSARAFPLGH